MLFNGPDNPQIAPYLHPHLMHGLLGQHESSSERHLNRFRRFFAGLTNMKSRQTTDTDHATSSARSNTGLVWR